MTAKPGDFHSDGKNDKTPGETPSEADSAIKRLYHVVNSDRDAAKPNLKPEIADARLTPPETPGGDSTAFLSPKQPLNYYEGKLSAGAGAAAETGLKGLFNVDYLNKILASNSDASKPYSANRVDGLSQKKDQSSSFVVPDFVPPFPPFSTG